MLEAYGIFIRVRQGGYLDSKISGFVECIGNISFEVIIGADRII